MATNFYSITQFDKDNYFILSPKSTRVIRENAKNVYLTAKTEFEYLGSIVNAYKYKCTLLLGFGISIFEKFITKR